MDQQNARIDNPFQPPEKREMDWVFDRSGTARRVAEIVLVSFFGAIGGGVIGTLLFPNFRIGGGGNLMVTIGAISCLTAWAMIKLRTMWKHTFKASSDSHVPD